MRKAFMAQSSMMDSCTHLAFEDSSETIVKRMKKEPGAVTGKSVVVLKDSDVTRRNEIVFMPNTIEMAQLKKPGKGQFKTNVQISSKMTEMDIKEILVATFPFLGHQRFYCAAAIDNRTRLDFHGQPRIWNGHFIKKKIKGNSALYIFTDEYFGDCQDSKVSEQSTLKRSHDQITTQENEKSEQSVKKEMESPEILKLSTGSSAYLGSEKQAKLYSVPNVSSKNIASHITEGSTVLEKSDNVLSSGAQSLQQKLLDRIPAPKGFVCVPVATAQQGMIPSLWQPSISANHETRNAKDVSVVNVGPASLSPSIPMGAIMVPAGDAVHPGAIPRAIISTTSDQQSLGQTVFHIVDGASDSRQTGLSSATHRMPQVMVSKMLTPQMTNLKISNALGSSVQLQKSSGKRDQSSQTVESSRDSLERVPSLMATSQSDENFPVELDKKAGTRPQAVVELGSHDQSKQSADKKNFSGASQAAENRAVYMKDATDRQCEEFAGASVSNHVSQLSDHMDSGFETSDNAGDVSLCKKTDVAVAMETTRLEQKVDKLDEAEWKENESGEEGGLSLLGSLALNALKIRSAVTETESAVEEIVPNSCSLKGGAKFLMILRERLPQDVVSGLAYFGGIAAVPLTKVNEFNMAGCVPAAPAPGVVSVKVQTSSGRYLGETSFEYTDLVSDVLQQILHDRKLQASLFRRFAEELERKTDETERKQPPESSSLKIADTGRPGSTTSTGSGRGICQPAELSDRHNSHLGIEDHLETLPPNLLEIAPLSDCSAAPAPGVVSVKVQTSSGRYLGETSFEYTDVISDVLQQILHDRKLQASLFRRFAEELERKTEETERRQPPESSRLKIADAGRPGSTKSTGSGRGICQPAELSDRHNSQTEGDYDADDEASSTDSLEDGDSCPKRSDFGSRFEIMCCVTVPVDHLERSKIENQRTIDGAGKLCPIETTRTSNLMEESTLMGLKSLPFKLLKTEDLDIKDNLETLPSGLPESAPLQDCSALSQSHKRVTGGVWNSQIMNEPLIPVNSDENSESDKTQRAHFARRRNEMDNSAAANL